MDREEIDKWMLAGKITGKTRDYGRTLVKKGAVIKDLLDDIEAKIVDLGGKPAFPAQISCNHIAAHFCPEENDNSVLGDDVVSLDVGVSVDGYIGDTAVTVDLTGKYKELLQASQDALDNALKIIKPGITTGEIGKTIQDTIQGAGFAPVRNLSGHGLDRYVQHTKPNIPNFNSGDDFKITSGMVFAVEPFASTGAGIVRDSGSATLFSLSQKRPVRNQIARQVLSEIENYNGLPFTIRWLTKKLGIKAKLGMRELMQAGILHDYPPLADQSKGIVSQAEHTILIDNDGAVHITTKV